MLLRRHVSLLVSFWISVCGQLHAVDQYFYYDDARPLTPIENTIAVCTASGSPLHGPSVRPLPISGWFILELEEPGRQIEHVVYSTPVYRSLEGGTVFPSRNLIVRFFNAPTPESLQFLATQGEIHSSNWAGLRHTYYIETSHTDGRAVLASANDLAKRPEVEFAEPDMVFSGRGALIPSDPLFPSSWALDNDGTIGLQGFDLGAIDAWDVSVGKPSTQILVIDTGVDAAHPDLSLLPGTDVTSDGPGDGSVANACDNHGTPVAGCINAQMDNAIGTVGMAPECRLRSARTFISDAACDGSWITFTSWTVEALEFAASSGVRVTNNSNVYGFSSSSIAAKYEATFEAGMVHFAPTGNLSASFVGFPANLESVIAVAGVGPDGNLYSPSHSGTETAFVGPADQIFTTDRVGTAGIDASSYAWTEGTSLACAFLSGTAALGLSVNSGLTASEIVGNLQASAIDLGAVGLDPLYGLGLPDTLEFLELCRPHFVRGDANNSGTLDIADAVTALGYLFASAQIDCELAVDANDDNSVQVSDPIFLLSALFTASSPLPSGPFPDCGVETGMAALSCNESPCP